MPRKRRKNKYWIQSAIGKPGALRRYVKWKYGEKAFTKKGTIKYSILKDLANEPGITGRRARLALTLRRLARKKKRKRKRKRK